MKKVFLGIDWGGTLIKIGVFDSKKGLLSKNKFDSADLSNPTYFFDCLKSAAQKTLKKHHLSISNIGGIGIGAPGIIEKNTGLIYYLPNIKGWEDYPFAKNYKKHFSAPLAIDNDANLAMLAESRQGIAKGYNYGAFLTLGTGLGCGLLLNGQLYRAKTSSAEGGHMPLNINGIKCGCGSRGCIETYAGSKYFVEKVKKEYRRKKKKIQNLNSLTAKDLYRLALKGDRITTNAWQDYGNILGIYCAGLINLLNLEIIVLGGGISKAYRLFIKSMRQAVTKRTMYPFSKQVKVKKSVLGDKAGIIGAFELIKTQIKNAD